MLSDESGTASTRSAEIARDLRVRLEAGEWAPGEKVPGEHDLARSYNVSRATIRTALQDLESRGWTVTRHGLGTVVTAHAVSGQADIRRLESLTDTIRRHGRTPGMKYRTISIRDALPEEKAQLKLRSDAQVLATERLLTADGVTVAFSFDAIPRAVLGDDFEITEVEGSLFGLLKRHGVQTAVAVTEIHAAHGEHIGWGDRPEDASYLLLVQLHSDVDGRAVFLARTYFIEGRFPFGLVRHR